MQNQRPRRVTFDEQRVRRVEKSRLPAVVRAAMLACLGRVFLVRLLLCFCVLSANQPNAKRSSTPSPNFPALSGGSLDVADDEARSLPTTRRALSLYARTSCWPSQCLSSAPGAWRRAYLWVRAERAKQKETSDICHLSLSFSLCARTAAARWRWSVGGGEFKALARGGGSRASRD